MTGIMKLNTISLFAMKADIPAKQGMLPWPCFGSSARQKAES